MKIWDLYRTGTDEEQRIYWTCTEEGPRRNTEDMGQIQSRHRGGRVKILYMYRGGTLTLWDLYREGTEEGQ